MRNNPDSLRRSGVVLPLILIFNNVTQDEEKQKDPAYFWEFTPLLSIGASERRLYLQIFFFFQSMI